MEDETPAEKLERLRSRLSVEQRRFCEEFMVSQDAASAYATAYGKTEFKGLAQRGFSLLERWYIQDYCKALLEDDGVNLQDLVITKSEVMHTLADRMRHSAEDKDRIRAAEIVGKFLGLGNTKKLEVTGRDGGPLKAELGLNEDQIKHLRANFLGVDPERISEGESD